MSRPSMAKRVELAHLALPPGLFMPVLAFLTLLGAIVMGLAIPLPPGPLCDEGMVLFMEGGCDWGHSNVFFYAKVSLLLSINLVFLLCCRWRIQPLPAFVPHLGLLGLMVACDLLAGPNGPCETYYSHPNGSLGQMIAEAAAFAVLGMRLVPCLFGRSWRVQLAALVGWNAVHVAVFYVWLLVTPHWTWLHTALIVGSLLPLGDVKAVLERRAGKPAR